MCGFRMEFRFFLHGGLAALLFLICLNPVMATSITCEGVSLSDNDEDTYYEISTCQQLQAMRSCLTNNFELVSDINCSFTAAGDQDGSGSNDLWTDASGFMPVGSSTSSFNGNLEGNRFAITNLHISRSYGPGNNGVGLFGFLAGDINNLRIYSTHVFGRRAITGILVGRMIGGSISNVSSHGEVRGCGHVGGLVGEIDSGIISNSYSEAYVHNTEELDLSGQVLGGLVGVMVGGTISNSYFIGRVEEILARSSARPCARQTKPLPGP
jgi:hypothetical protein